MASEPLSCSVFAGNTRRPDNETHLRRNDALNVKNETKNSKGLRARWTPANKKGEWAGADNQRVTFSSEISLINSAHWMQSDATCINTEVWRLINRTSSVSSRDIRLKRLSMSRRNSLKCDLFCECLKKANRRSARRLWKTWCDANAARSFLFCASVNFESSLMKLRILYSLYATQIRESRTCSEPGTQWGSASDIVAR